MTSRRPRAVPAPQPLPDATLGAEQAALEAAALRRQTARRRAEQARAAASLAGCVCKAEQAVAAAADEAAAQLGRHSSRPLLRQDVACIASSLAAAPPSPPLRVDLHVSPAAAEVVMQEWAARDGDVLDELAALLRCPHGCNVALQRLAEAARQLGGADGSAVERLLLCLCVLPADGIDALLGAGADIRNRPLLSTLAAALDAVRAPDGAGPSARAKVRRVARTLALLAHLCSTRGAEAERLLSQPLGALPDGLQCAAKAAAADAAAASDRVADLCTDAAARDAWARAALLLRREQDTAEARRVAGAAAREAERSLAAAAASEAKQADVVAGLEAALAEAREMLRERTHARAQAAEHARRTAAAAVGEEGSEAAPRQLQPTGPAQLAEAEAEAAAAEDRVMAAVDAAAAAAAAQRLRAEAEAREAAAQAAEVLGMQSAAHEDERRATAEMADAAAAELLAAQRVDRLAASAPLAHAQLRSSARRSPSRSPPLPLDCWRPHRGGRVLAAASR
eukprot:TRINITY_DN9882_c0_g1_i2.p2 TRINITY_DN9882_c0_g1~~TRINITY_DN9882_c0_g1_i2.p2  ORF type:complete len:528 (+),score=236.87 TRINITY_DN9882_c0_g1_i2:52-1584(+)